MSGEILRISKQSSSSTEPKIAAISSTGSSNVKAISSNDSTDDEVIERDNHIHLKLEIEEKYESMKMKYEELLKKYNEQNENIQSLQIMNIKLQKMLFEAKSDKDSMYKIKYVNSV